MQNIDISINFYSCLSLKFFKYANNQILILILSNYFYDLKICYIYIYNIYLQNRSSKNLNRNNNSMMKVIRPRLFLKYFYLILNKK